MQHDGRQVQAQSVGQVPGDQKQHRRRLLGGPAEPAVEDLVRCEQLAAKVVRQEQEDDQKPADDVADRQLQEDQTAALVEKYLAFFGVELKQESRDAQERDRARLGGYDRQHHPPPGQAPSAQQVTGNVALPATHPNTEEHYAQQIGNENRRIDSADLRIHCSRPDGVEGYNILN